MKGVGIEIIRDRDEMEDGNSRMEMVEDGDGRDEDGRDENGKRG